MRTTVQILEGFKSYLVLDLGSLDFIVRTVQILKDLDNKAFDFENRVNIEPLSRY